MKFVLKNEDFFFFWEEYVSGLINFKFHGVNEI